MSKSEIQKQVGGDSSTQYQANNDIVIHQGASYQEIKEIAMDVFKSNFFELSGQANNIANERAEDITDTLIGKLLKVSNEFNFASDPDFQYSVYLVQREYARTGNDELGDLLTDILVDRSKHKDRDILQVVLNESLSVAPKLTSVQISTLTLIHMLTNVYFTDTESYYKLESIYDEVYDLVADVEEITESNVMHLEYAGTLSVNHIIKKDITKKVFDSYNYISNEETLDDFVREISEKAPSLKLCIDLFNQKKMYRTELTSVGMLLGLANLRKIAPWIDYSIWIK